MVHDIVPILPPCPECNVFLNLLFAPLFSSFHISERQDVFALSQQRALQLPSMRWCSKHISQTHQVSFNSQSGVQSIVHMFNLFCLTLQS